MKSPREQMGDYIVIHNTWDSEAFPAQLLTNPVWEEEWWGGKSRGYSWIAKFIAPDTRKIGFGAILGYECRYKNGKWEVDENMRKYAWKDRIRGTWNPPDDIAKQQTYTPSPENTLWKKQINSVLQNTLAHNLLVYHMLVRARDHLDHGRWVPMVPSTIEMGWIQNARAGNMYDTHVHPLDSEAITWSVYGILERVAFLRLHRSEPKLPIAFDDIEKSLQSKPTDLLVDSEKRLYEGAKKIIEGVIQDDIEHWNDQKDRTEKQVLEMLDAAIDKAWYLVVNTKSGEGNE